jgi:Cu(I)/Ag(I) efflux system membrane fusion protein
MTVASAIQTRAAQWLTLIIIIGCSVLLLGSCSRGKAPMPPRAEVSSPAKIAGPAKAEVWTCTMHPHIHEHQPGNCPICGMKLVRVVNDEGGSDEVASAEAKTPRDHAGFKLSLERRQLIGVKFGLVEKKPLFKSIRASGSLAFDPELYTAQGEYVEAIRQLGRVKDSPLADVQHSSKRMVESAKLRLRILGLSDAQINQIGSSGNSGNNLLLNRKGDSAWVYADIYEMDLAYVHPGMAAEVTAGFLGGQTLQGQVIAVDRVINPTTRTARARITVRDAKTVLRPESYVDVTIHSPMGEQVVVPFDAVLDTGDQAWVFLTDGSGKFDPRLVSIKFRAGDQIAIGSGLQGGEKIVTSANFMIDSESRLKFGQMEESVPSSGKTPGKSAAPACPAGQHWDTSMSMCMVGQ